MDSRTFRRLCANVDRLSVGHIQDLWRKLRELGARRAVLAQIDARGQALEACVHSGAAALVRWGSTRTGLQRLRCKTCGRTFSSDTRHGPGPRAPAREAVCGAQRHVGGGAELVPQACGPARGGQMTACCWRMRLLEALEGVGGRRPGLPLFSGIVEADETYARESRKGTRDWVNHARAPEHHPRSPRPRWQDFRRRGTGLPAGLSRWHIPVLTLGDRAGGRHAEVLPDRRAERLIARLETRIRRDAVLLLERRRRLPPVRPGAQPAALQTQRQARPAGHPDRLSHPVRQQSAQRRFEAFMRPFCGPATKHLPAYIAWFIARLADQNAALINDACQQMVAA